MPWGKGLAERGYRPPVSGDRAFVVFQMEQVNDSWWTNPVVNVHFYDQCVTGDKAESFYLGTKSLDVSSISGVKQTLKIPAGRKLSFDYGWSLGGKSCRVQGSFVPQHQFLYRFLYSQADANCGLEIAEMTRSISGVDTFRSIVSYDQHGGGKKSSERVIAADWVRCQTFEELAKKTLADEARDRELLANKSSNTADSDSRVGGTVGNVGDGGVKAGSDVKERPAIGKPQPILRETGPSRVAKPLPVTEREAVDSPVPDQDIDEIGDDFTIDIGDDDDDIQLIFDDIPLE